MLRLYTDGGCIKKNPSPLGGTYAWIIVDEYDSVMDSGFGTISPSRMGTMFVTNNQTELYAVVKGLEHLWDNEVAEICSDSQITLGRIFEGYTFNNIPNWIQNQLRMETTRLNHFDQFKYTLMDGHPTKEQVEKGIGKKGHVTSKFNVWCDEHCQEAARIYLESIYESA